MHEFAPETAALILEAERLGLEVLYDRYPNPICWTLLDPISDVGTEWVWEGSTLAEAFAEYHKYASGETINGLV